MIKPRRCTTDAPPPACVQAPDTEAELERIRTRIRAAIGDYMRNQRQGRNRGAR